MANIRNHCSWVHSDDWEGATRKAEELVRMAVARARELQPLHTSPVPTEKAALIIGGGVAGMTSALTLARQGFPVHLVECSEALGGNLRHLYYALEEVCDLHTLAPPDDSGPARPQQLLATLVQAVETHPLISLHLQTEVLKTDGFVGRFVSTLQRHDGDRVEVHHGATILGDGWCCSDRGV